VLGYGVIDPLFFDLGIKTEVFGVLHAPSAFPRYLFCKRLNGAHSRSGRCRVEKDLLPLPEVEPRLSSQYPVSIPTELFRLRERRYNLYCVNYAQVIRNIDIVKKGQFFLFFLRNVIADLCAFFYLATAVPIVIN
jgi:hypothetical protein